MFPDIKRFRPDQDISLAEPSADCQLPSAKCQLPSAKCQVLLHIFSAAPLSKYHSSSPSSGQTFWQGKFAVGSLSARRTISAFSSPLTRNITHAALFSIG